MRVYPLSIVDIWGRFSSFWALIWFFYENSFHCSFDSADPIRLLRQLKLPCYIQNWDLTWSSFVKHKAYFHKIYTIRKVYKTLCDMSQNSISILPRDTRLFSKSQIMSARSLAMNKRCNILHLLQFPHLAIAVSPRLEVESSGHAWLDGCNFQRKQLPAPHGVPPAPLCVDNSGAANENIDDSGNLHK